ncbi:MAG TPA: hypothetical protein VFD04_19815 [Actinomycetes bacterium]|jgi:hypothetical protein|nr:hypothetical protein [Actinomycetes bacterium]
MRTPALDQRHVQPSVPGPARRRHRGALIATGALLLLVAAGAGIAAALVTRPVAPATPAAVAAPTTVASPPTVPILLAPPTTVTVAAPTPVLADGAYDGYIRRVDPARRRIVVDLVQVFEGQAAVDAAVADGKPRNQARYLEVYLRNQNPRLRTLPLAGGLVVQLRGSCEEPAKQAVMLRLAADARLPGYYYHLTVRGGAVQRIEERFSGLAC